jgi:hypothetical protein
MDKRILGRTGFFKKNAFLLGCLLVLTLSVTVALSRMHILAKRSFGQDFAVILVAALIAWMLFVVLLGLRLGSYVESSMKKRTLTRKQPSEPGSLLDMVMRIWGHKIEIGTTQAKETNNGDILPGITFDDAENLLTILGRKKHGGKKSPHPDKVRFRAVQDWMILQTNETSITLQEFLEERFGVAPETGMPLVPNQTFYGWRRKFIKELKSYKE